MVWYLHIFQALADFRIGIIIGVINSRVNSFFIVSAHVPSPLQVCVY